MALRDFSGVWLCRYWFPSNQFDGEDISSCEVKIHRNGNQLVLESLPNKEEAFLSARMVADGDVVTGTWQENTSPHGEFAGSIYSGAVQLIANGDGDRIEGKWVGIGQENGKKQVYTGRWEISKK
jgi:hypothetical protein